MSKLLRVYYKYNKDNPGCKYSKLDYIEKTEDSLGRIYYFRVEDTTIVKGPIYRWRVNKRFVNDVVSRGVFKELNDE